MNDLIARARKEWCEPFTPRSTLSTPIWYPCPPSVVAALLDVLADSEGTAYCYACGSLRNMPDHTADCPVGIALAAITRALEGEP
jgi:hypothetical protein